MYDCVTVCLSFVSMFVVFLCVCFFYVCICVDCILTLLQDLL